MSATLGLFAKWPRPGMVKTRLAAATSAPWAAKVAQAFLQDMLCRLTHVNARRVLVFSPTDAGKDFADLVRGDFELLPQVHDDLGARLFAFFNQTLEEGAERVVALGTDSPTLPVAFVETALDQLRHADVVLGPATDGGYYLIGCAHRVPPIFHGVGWSSSSVLAETVSRLRQASLRLALLPPWYDVDTLDDWRMLRGHVLALRCAGGDPEVPHTEALPDEPS
jgi:rSAM/selenodomain-associated transferase 1